MTAAVKDALSLARTKESSYLADDIIIHRNDDAYLASRINDTSRIALVREAMAEAHIRLVNRVIEAVSRFEGYSHVMVIGGGAELIADAVRNHCAVRDGRFYKTSSSQFDLVNGMYLIG
jgi:plasmid segregation protein ParM